MQYYNIPNKILDFSLSADSLKVLLYLYTRPPNWKIWNKKVMTDVKISNQKLAKVWKELLAKGLIERERERYKNGAIKGGGYIYKINCNSKMVDTGIVENGITVQDVDFMGVSFEDIWQEHKEYRKKFGNKLHGKKTLAKQKYIATFKEIKKKFKVEDNDDIINAIKVVVAEARKEKYTPYLQNILDTETVVDKIEELL